MLLVDLVIENKFPMDTTYACRSLAMAMPYMYGNNLR